MGDGKAYLCETTTLPILRTQSTWPETIHTVQRKNATNATMPKGKTVLQSTFALQSFWFCVRIPPPTAQN